MKYYAFVFRDLDNNLVLARPDPKTQKLDFHVLGGTDYKIEALPLDTVNAVHIDEEQEDIFEMTHLFRLRVENELNEACNLAELAEEDQEAFYELTDSLYETILESVKQKTPENGNQIL